MKHARLRWIALLALAALTNRAAAQSTLPANTFVVVTTDGLFVPDPASSTPRLHIPASQFPGHAGQLNLLTRPAIEWDRATDSFLVCADRQLFEIEITSLAPPVWAIADITPTSFLPLDIWDLDVHPGTGELFLLDQTANEALRFAPPFAKDMAPDLALAVPGTSRALAIDSRSDPPAVIVTETSQVSRVKYNGATSVLNLFTGGRGVDSDPQVLGNGSTLLVATNTDKVARATNSQMLIVNMNLFGFCTPLAIAPTDVEWNPLKNRAFVLAGEGINRSFSCQQQVPAVGPNHVVAFPIAQAPPVVVPKLKTFSGGSGITGTEGDLTLVLEDFAFLAPFGNGCVAGAGDPIKLDSPYPPELQFNEYVLETTDAPANAPAFLIIGFSLDDLPLASGCSLLVAPDFIRSVGSTDASGELALMVPKPPGAVPGYEAFVQMAVVEGGGVTLSQGLQVRFGN